MRTYRTVSIEASPDYLDRLAVYARLNDIPVGKIVRQALDEQLSDKMENFFAKPVSFEKQIVERETTAKKDR